MPREEYFCGCCGGPCAEVAEWCALCDEHVGRTGPLWERTYQALHRKPYPYQVKRRMGGHAG